MRELIGDVAAREPHTTFYFISTGVIHGVDIMCGPQNEGPSLIPAVSRPFFHIC
jgi:hypothetical protein